MNTRIVFDDIYEWNINPDRPHWFTSEEKCVDGTVRYIRGRLFRYEMRTWFHLFGTSKYGAWFPIESTNEGQRLEFKGKL